MSILRRKSPAATVSLVVGRPWLNPGLDQALNDVAAAGDENAAVDAALAHVAAVRNDPERLVQGTDVLCEVLVPRVELLRERARRAGSGAAAADVVALLGATLVHAAWEVRGSGWASTVSQEARVTFRSMLEEADGALVTALERDPEHAAAGCFRLTTAMGLSAPSDEWWARFEVARRSRSTLYQAHIRMLLGMCAKWYGSDETMFSFATAVAEQAPPGDPVVAVLPMACAEFFLNAVREKRGAMAISREMHRRRDEVAAASDRWLGTGTPPPHPYSVAAHHIFAWYLEGKDKRRLRTHVEQVDLRLADYPWDYVGDPAERFRSALAAAGVG